MIRKYSQSYRQIGAVHENDVFSDVLETIGLTPHTLMEPSISIGR